MNCCKWREKDYPICMLDDIAFQIYNINYNTKMKLRILTWKGWCKILGYLIFVMMPKSSSKTLRNNVLKYQASKISEFQSLFN